MAIKLLDLSTSFGRAPACQLAVCIYFSPLRVSCQGVSDGKLCKQHPRTVATSALITPRQLVWMDFSETYRFSGPVPIISPDGKHIAAATEYRLVVRDVLTTQVLQIYSCIDKISHVEWCPNSTYILCGLVKRAVVQVWSVREPDWTCKIDEGLAGAEAVQWSPDGLHILVTADFQIR